MISDGAVIIHQNDIATTYEKADNVTVQQAITVAVKEPRSALSLFLQMTLMCILSRVWKHPLGNEQS